MMKPLLLMALLAFLQCATAALSQTDAGSSLAIGEAVPMEPIPAILDAFGFYAVVGLGEEHNEPLVHAFRLALIRHPKFPFLVNDIVVESGGWQFQDAMDKYVHGDAMPDSFLREVASSAAATFEDPMYEDIPRTVRALNRELPPERQIRVLLGEAPDHRDRDAFVTEVIRREVVAKQRRALVVYGRPHMLRRHAVSVEEIETERWLVNRLERIGTRVFAIWPARGTGLRLLQPNVAKWQLPALAIVKGTPLGVADFAFYHSFGGWRLKNGQPILKDGVPTYDPPRPGLRMEEQVDALLYLSR